MLSWQRSSFRFSWTSSRSEVSRRTASFSNGRATESFGSPVFWPSLTCSITKIYTKCKSISLWLWFSIFSLWRLLKVSVGEASCQPALTVPFLAIARRRRPSVNDDPFCIGPDVYSFPSGHASRSSLLLGFFTCLYSSSFFFWPPLLAWWFSICLSRSVLFIPITCLHQVIESFWAQIDNVSTSHPGCCRWNRDWIFGGFGDGHHMDWTRDCNVTRQVDLRWPNFREWRRNYLKTFGENLFLFNHN